MRLFHAPYTRRKSSTLSPSARDCSPASPAHKGCAFLCRFCHQGNAQPVRACAVFYVNRKLCRSVRICAVIFVYIQASIYILKSIYLCEKHYEHMSHEYRKASIIQEAYINVIQKHPMKHY